MTKQRLVVVLAMLVLIVLSSYLAVDLMNAKKALKQAQAQAEEANAKKPIVEFNKMFVEKVLKAPGEVSFETRLELENSVRNLGDAEILAQWNKFVNAADEKEAQVQVKELLGILAAKMNG